MIGRNLTPLWNNLAPVSIPASAVRPPYENVMNIKLSLLPLALAACLAHADTPMSVAIKAAKEYENTTLKKDFASFEKSATTDFVYINAKGQKTSKAQAIGGMKAFYGMLEIKSLDVKAVSAKRAEGGVVYIQTTKLLGSMKMGGPKPSKFESTSRDEVLLVQKGGRWLTKRVKNLKSVDLLDGKPMPGM